MDAYQPCTYVCHARSHEMQPAGNGTRAADVLLHPRCLRSSGKWSNQEDNDQLLFSTTSILSENAAGD